MDPSFRVAVMIFKDTTSRAALLADGYARLLSVYLASYATTIVRYFFSRNKKESLPAKIHVHSTNGQ